MNKNGIEHAKNNTDYEKTMKKCIWNRASWLRNYYLVFLGPPTYCLSIQHLFRCFGVFTNFFAHQFFLNLQLPSGILLFPDIYPLEIFYLMVNILIFISWKLSLFPFWSWMIVKLAFNSSPIVIFSQYLNNINLVYCCCHFYCHSFLCKYVPSLDSFKISSWSLIPYSFTKRCLDVENIFFNF